MATSEVEKAEAVEVARTEHTHNGRHYRPNVDIVESAGELTVFADMPGTSGDDVDINFENGTLTIHGKVRNCEPEDAGPVSREYGVGAQILRHLGVRKMRLITNNPRKYHALSGYGLEIVERVPIEAPPRKENLRYLRTKKEKMGHLLSLDEQVPGEDPADEDEPSDPQQRKGTT